MTPSQSLSPIRTRIVLEGGGRLDDVAQIMDIRLEPEPVEWTRVGPDSLEVNGAINAYFYCLRSRGRGVEGQGFRIPFSRRIPTEGLDLAGLRVSLEQLESTHDFNPVSGDFQHKVTAFVVLNEASTGQSRQSPPAEDDAEPKSQSAANPSAPGETRLSQIRSGERSQGEHPESEDDEAPASSRPPSPEEFESMRQAIEGRSSKRPAADEVANSPPQEEEALNVPMHNDEPPRHPEQLSHQRAEESQRPEETGQQLSQAKKSEKESGETLVWKPFPPPIV